MMSSPCPQRGLRGFIALCLITLASLANLASAQTGAAAEPDPKQVWAEAREAALTGPQPIRLLELASLALPAGHVFVPQPQAGRVLRAMGNPGQDSSLQGLIFPTGDQGWFMTVRYENSGHVADSDAAEWNADELLKSYREGTEAANEERVKMGTPGLEILGWAETPRYDAASHRLVWAMISREKGSTDAEQQGVNLNTYLLGREGYFMLNLVTDLKDLATHKPEGQALLAALAFNEGQRYTDFNASTDHLAEYGLAALVVGVGAKKLGLLAVIGVFLAKFAKIILIAVLGFGGGLAKLLARRRAAKRSDTGIETDTDKPAA